MNYKTKAKQIVIISGKGGTGKTSLAASFASLYKNAVIADCDVDASDLYLVTGPEKISEHVFISGNEAVIDVQTCIGCGYCSNLCRFDAINKNPASGKYFTDILSCEGCGVCADNCPSDAIRFPERNCGKWMVSKTRYGTMVHAELNPGAENSGKLVTLVRNEALKISEKQKAQTIIIDGPPGIGCPVIASITGTDYIVAITEPTLSGHHDLIRILELINFFKIPVFVCINKWDINPEMTLKIEEMSQKSGAGILGRISYDTDVTEAQIKGISAVEIKNSISSKEITEIWKKLLQLTQHLPEQK